MHTRRLQRARAASLPALVILLALALSLTAGDAAAQAASRAGPAQGTWYRVEIPEHDRRLAHVDARIELTDSVLIMFPDGAGHLPQGWSTYLRGLTATTDAGQPVRLRRQGRDRWVVPRPRPRAIRLRYEVLLHHDAGNWPFGSKEAGYVKEDGAFLTGKALFIAQYGLRPARVQFVLPPRWRIATPWADAPGEGMTFTVPHAGELLQVGMLAGRHQQRRLLLDGTTVILAVGQSLPNSMDLFAQALSPALRSAADLFGGTPRGKFVVIANADSYSGGTAFTRSFDLVFEKPPSEANRAEWSHLILHELLHLWLGGAIGTAQGTQEFWFTEGATDYLANLLQVRAGLISADAFYARIARHWDEYRAVADRLPLHAAGEDKAKNYTLVYSGGLLASFVLDTELRRASGGRVGIDSLMRRLYADHGRTGRPLSGRDIRRVVSQLYGGDIGWLFTNHVNGSALLPVPDALAHLGRVLTTSTAADSVRSRIATRPDATAAQRTLERSLLGTPGQ